MIYDVAFVNHSKRWCWWFEMNNTYYWDPFVGTGLGILGPPTLQTVKTETSSTPPPAQEYNGLEGLELEMAPFELNLTPKTEPQDLDLNIAQPCLVQNLHHLPSELVSTPGGGIVTTQGIPIVTTEGIVTTQGIVTTHQILNVSLPPQYRSMHATNAGIWRTHFLQY